MPRAAVLLSASPNAPSLAWWLAHHMAAGFSALLACVRENDAATRDLLETASMLHDVRWETRPAPSGASTSGVANALPTETTSTKKTDAGEADERKALSALVRSKSDSLDWLLALSQDEFFLPAQGTVETFLEEALSGPDSRVDSDKALLAVNWCIAGLNGHDPANVRPLSPRALYTRHAPRALPDHRVTRSFFRTPLLSEAGSQASEEDAFPDPFAHTDRAPDWTKARILHDAAAVSHGVAQRYFDRNEEEDRDGRRLLPESRHLAAGLVQTALYTLWQTLSAQTSSSAGETEAQADGEAESEQSYLNVFTLHDSAGRQLVVDKTSGAYAWQSPESKRKADIALHLAVSSGSGAAWLYASAPLELAYLPLPAPDAAELGELLAILPLRIEKKENGLELRRAVNDALFVLPESRSSGTDLSDNSSDNLADDPEEKAELRLLPLPPEEASTTAPYQTLLALTRSGLPSANTLGERLHHLPYPDPSALGALIPFLPPEESALLLPPFLKTVFF